MPASKRRQRKPAGPIHSERFTKAMGDKRLLWRGGLGGWLTLLLAHFLDP
ncbi:hypothetical protein LMG26411_08134 [Cupriavidus numazuensis]|uniref:Uncharacterized protein n=1 Tax=Cupriavidus numazuensis TaxID=221992 RepID=A0ABN7QCC4_9BURK|nr:hypothetical protein LMG26411_08134 [Cupriavidus numazuensis]